MAGPKRGVDAVPGDRTAAAAGGVKRRQPTRSPPMRGQPPPGGSRDGREAMRATGEAFGGQAIGNDRRAIGRSGAVATRALCLRSAASSGS